MPGLPKGIRSDWEGKKYVARWAYKNAEGETIGYVVRFEAGSGEKVIIPYFNRDGDKWKAGYSKNLKEFRPLYNLDKITVAPMEEEIFAVEGEKVADALTKLGFLAVTSPGGASAASKADWFPMSGRRAIIWPDNDPAGITYAANVYQNLIEAGDSDPDIKMVEVEKLGLKEKDDAVDFLNSGKTKRDILNLPLKQAYDISDFGARANRIDVQSQIYTNLEIATSANLSEKQDTDMIEALMDLKAKEVAYQAALSAAAKTMQLSLVDFL